MAKKKCACETRSGKKCKNYALQYTDYCSMHQDCEKDYKKKKGKRSPKKKSVGRRSPRGSGPPAQYRCACTNKDGSRCKKWTTLGSIYCNVHENCVSAPRGVAAAAAYAPAAPSYAPYASQGLFNAAQARNSVRNGGQNRFSIGVAQNGVPVDDNYPDAARLNNAPGLTLSFPAAVARAAVATPAAVVAAATGRGGGGGGGAAAAEDYDATYGAGDGGYGSPGRAGGRGGGVLGALGGLFGLGRGGDDEE